MPVTDADQMPGENSPTELILFAAIRMAEQYHLPAQGRLRRLVRHPDDELSLRKLSKEYGRLALTDILHGDVAKHAADDHDYDPPIALARSVVAATSMVWKIRVAAQGMLTVAPSMEVWELYALIATVVYNRARAEGDTLALTEFVDDLARQITDL